jgi:hypothetical protein
MSADVVEVEHLDAVAGEALRRGFRTGDGAGDAVLDLAQLVDEAVGRRAGADADDGAGHHVVDGGAGHRLLEFVLGHFILPIDGFGRILLLL